MQGGLRRGLHIDDDDEARKPDEYGGLDPSRKRGNFEKNLDDMLFGGGPAPARRRPTGEKKQQVNTSKTKDVAKPETKPEAVTSKEPPKVSPNTSGNKVSPNTSGNIGATYKKQPSILVPDKGKDAIDPTPTIGLISSPQINNYVDPNKSGSNKPQPPSKPTVPEQKPVQPKPAQPETVKPQPTKPVEAPQPPKPVEAPQPAQQVQQISIQVLHPFGNKNKYNKPGMLRKGKKIAEDFKFSDDNVTLNSAVDVVRPFQTDRARQRKLNDFDFHDFEFPASSLSLGAANKDTPSVWKKPNEIAKTVNFGKYIDPNDFQPGSLSSPHFLSTLSGIAELEANTKRLIQDQKTNSNGFYLIRLFVNSVWRYIAVDNSLPFVNGQNAGVIGNTQGGELDLHTALIEKAYAKSFGGYDVFSKTRPREHYLRDLTGSPVKKYNLDQPDLQNIVKKALASGQVVQAVPTEKIAALGVNPNYSYSVINLTAKGSLQLRNSWGTVEERSKTSFRAEGNFEIPAGILRDNISHLFITSLNTAYSTTTIQSKHRPGFYSTYSFKVKNPTHGFFTVSQWDDRLFPSNSNYSYSPATILIQKDGGQVEFISANHTSGSRNLDLQVQLAPGDYTVFAAVNWNNGQHNFNLSFYGSERIDFSRVYNDKNPNHIAQSLEWLNVSSGKKVQTSKTSAQYTSHHYESNLFLLTVQNTSNREGRVNIDISKVKLDKVTLVSGHNNEENYSEKVGYQIDDYKQAPLNDKRWGVNLEAGKRFTLVFASREAYNEANAKAWGFI